MDYWKECVTEAMEDAGIKATNEQIETVCSWVEGAHDNYGMAHGHDCIPNPMESEVDKLKQEIRRLKDDHDRQLDGVIRGVAKRRNVSVSDVSIDDDGLVYIRG
jgi:hypothetical protein